MREKTMEKQENNSIFWINHAKKSETGKKGLFYRQSVKIQPSGLQMSLIPKLGLGSKARKSIFKKRGMHGFGRRNVFDLFCLLKEEERKDEMMRTHQHFLSAPA